MNKTGLVFQREYLSRVQKKSFLLVTILIPVIIIGFYVAIIAVAISGNSTMQKIAVIDQAGLLGNKDFTQNEFSFHLAPPDQQPSLQSGYDKQGYDGLLLIPPTAVEQPDSIRFQRKSEAGAGAQSDLNKILSEAIGRKRMEATLKRSNTSPRMSP